MQTLDGRRDACVWRHLTQEALRCSAPLLAAALWLVLPLAAAAGGESPGDNDVVVHPLNTEAAWRLRGDRPGAEAWATLVWQEGPDVLSGAAEAVFERAGPSPIWRAEPLPPLRAALAPTLVDLVAASSSDVRVEVVVATRRQDWMPFPSMSYVEEVALLEGRARTHGALRQVRQEAFDAWRAASDAATAPIVAAVHRAGGEVVDQSWLAGQVMASVPAGKVGSLLDAPGVASVDILQEERDDNEGYTMFVSGPPLDGVERTDLIQAGQFYAGGYEGAGWVVVTEGASSNVFRGHPGFKSGAGAERYVNCASWSTVTQSCLANPNPGFVPWAPGGAHATATAAVLLGDITRNQDPNIVGVNARRARSGVAPTAFGVGPVNTATRDLIVASTTFAPRVITMSHTSGGQGAVPCDGQTNADQRGNANFEAGVAFIKSAGNSGVGGSTCKVGPPGPALGTLAVSAYRITPDGDAAHVENSSRGGASDGRSVVDVTAPTLHEFAYPHFMWPMGSNGSGLMYGTQWPHDPGPALYSKTSVSTPGAAGAAVLLRHWWLNELGTTINNPVTLYLALLLMTDRTTMGSTRLTTGFDDFTGGGRLRLRRLAAAGLEAPSQSGSGSVCVNQGQTQVVPLAAIFGNQPPDMFRVVTWNYDRGHDAGLHPFAKVDLEVFRLNPATQQKVLVAADASDDHKKRIHVGSPWSFVGWELRLTGRDVRTDVEGCGQDGVRVFYAWFAEGSARPVGGPLSDVRPE